MAVELKDDVYWVGVVDWNIKHFHGHEYSTHRGTTYNAYLIIDEKIALVDTVYGPYSHELIENIEKIIDIKKIDLFASVENRFRPESGAASIRRCCLPWDGHQNEFGFRFAEGQSEDSGVFFRCGIWIKSSH